MTTDIQVPELDPGSLAGVLARHRAFWAREPADRPLVSVVDVRPREPTGPPGDAVPVTPMSVAGRAPSIIESLEARFEKHGVTRGDLFAADPFPSPPWMEAVLGCPIEVYASSATYWRERLPGGWRQAQSLGPDTGVSWRRTLLSLFGAASVALGSRFPLGNPLLRAPVDCLAAMIGDEALCYLLLDQPESVKPVAAACADVWLDLTSDWMELATPFSGGHFNQMGLWAPGTTTIFSVDASNLISPELYASVFMPLDTRLAQGVDYPVVHVHAESVHQVDGWAAIPGLAVQFGDGCIPVAEGWTSRTPWPKVLDACTRIQAQGRPLILYIAAEHFAEVQETLDPAGLACHVSRRVWS